MILSYYVVCCGFDSPSPTLSVLCQFLPLAMLYAGLSELPLQLVFETLAGGTMVTLALAELAVKDGLWHPGTVHA